MIPAIVMGILDAVLEPAPSDYHGPVKVEFRRTSEGQRITFLFSGLVNRDLMESADTYLMRSSSPWYWQIGAAAALSSTFSMSASDGRQTVRWQVREGGPPAVSRRRAKASASVRISLEPDTKILGRSTQDEMFKIIGCIRDHAALRAGLFISFKHGAFPTALGYYYPEGLKSLLFEADYQRHALHLGTLSFHRKTRKMSVEGHLRIMHAGVPSVWNYVNFKPTQGGAHVEGLGDALRDLFPDSTAGCRELELVTNPDTGARVKVPHSLIGTLHLRSSKACYAGPTKDVLIGDDVREFVHKAASATLRRQWDFFRKAQEKEREQLYRKMKASGQME